MNVSSKLRARPRILVVTMRRLGDVLLTTPLLRTLRQGYPDATLDVLVFRGSEGILAGNPDVNRVLTIAERPSARAMFAMMRQLFRGYDLAVSTQPGDRPTFITMIAGRRRVGMVPRTGDGAWWKRHAHHVSVVPEDNDHRVENLLRIADALGLKRQPGLVIPGGARLGGNVTGDYAVLHAHPMFRYKQWTQSGWRSLAHMLKERVLAVMATGSADARERAYLDELWSADDAAVERLDGRLSWQELAALISGAAVFIGPDTSVTHLAAGPGCPTVALYGPTDPRLWGPWPVGGLDQPWAAAGSIQRRGNVWLVQNSLPCTPCQKEGCDRHLESHSQCLDELSVRHVVAAVDQALQWGRERDGQWRGGKKAGMEGDMPLHSVKQ